MPEPLSIYAAVSITLNLAKEIYGIVHSLANAEKDALEYEHRWKAVVSRMECYEAFFRENERNIQHQTAATIKIAITKMNVSLSKVQKKLSNDNPFTKRIRWAKQKSELDKTMEHIGYWEQQLMTTFSHFDPLLRQRLGEKFASQQYLALFRPMAALMHQISVNGKRLEMKNSTAGALLDSIEPEPEDNPEGRIYFWKDTIQFIPEVSRNENELKEAKVEIARLTEVLKEVNPELTSLLQASSWFQRENDTFGIAYRMPGEIQNFGGPNFKTPTLKDMVMRPAEHPLNFRCDLAIDIASAISYIHSFNWVHKDIRSKNVLLVYKNDDPRPPHGLGKGYVVGFSTSRRRHDKSQKWLPKLDELNWRKQLYQHPERQLRNLPDEEGPFYDTVTEQDPVSDTDEDLPWAQQPSYESYKFKHDIYSLGVVLLELGLWKYLGDDDTFRAKTPEGRRNLLLSETEPFGPLAQAMGQGYAAVARACLNVDGCDCKIDQVMNALHKLKHRSSEEGESRHQLEGDSWYNTSL